jgi:hypothetical protein
MDKEIKMYLVCGYNYTVETSDYTFIFDKKDLAKEKRRMEKDGFDIQVVMAIKDYVDLLHPS